jgi:hypothetical protein
MEKQYHIQITTQALNGLVSSRALQVILTANLRQDRLSGQIAHPEYHCDHPLNDGLIYLEKQRQAIQHALRAGQQFEAWRAFGRLSHAAQDFYAHSNYVLLWAQNNLGIPPGTPIDPLDPQILGQPRLCSGKIYFPGDWLPFIPGLAGLAARMTPADSHTHCNLDSPQRGALFDLALEAATLRTRIELDQLLATAPVAQAALFTDLAREIE